jgi:tryptophanyl-tRNA synthetase
MNKGRVPEVDTALHIVKGAVCRVLKAPVTTATECAKKNEGRLTVEWSNGEATPEQVAKIEELINQKIRENVDITVTPMDRKEAEAKYRDKPVNGMFIYDKFPVPESVTQVNVLEIPDWNVNCCSGTHLKKTGEVRPIKITRQNYRENKKELQFVFELLDAPAATTSSSSSSSASSSPAASSSSNNNAKKGGKAAVPDKPAINTREIDDVRVVSDKLLNEMLEELKKIGGAAAALSAEQQAQLLSTLRPRYEQRLTSLKNQAFTNGFTAKI